ncbi:unnamed protein product, partial [Medioppia subpectinata]
MRYDRKIPKILAKISASKSSSSYDWCEWDQSSKLFKCLSDTNDLNMKEVFETLSTKTPFRFISKFTWSANVAGGTIPEYVFGNHINPFRFKKIVLDAPNLSKINANAFGSSHAIETFEMLGLTSNKLRHTPGDYINNLYRAFENIVSLTTLQINLDWDYEHEIPSNAFSFANNLVKLRFNDKTNDTTVLCNKNHEYDGQYGMQKWPQVPAGQSVRIKCPNSDKYIEWKCLESGKFDETELCWLEDLVNKTFESIDEVQHSLQTIVDNTKGNESLKSMDSLGKVMSVVINMQDFMQQTVSGIVPTVAVNVSDNFVHTFSQVIDQSRAWSDGVATDRLTTASQMLRYIQYTAFSSNCYLSPLNDTKEFLSKNLIQKHYYNKTNDKILFEYNSSSILIPDGVVFKDANYSKSCQSNTDFGALIQGLEKHLSTDLVDTQTINTEIIAFSINNANGTHQLNDGKNVRVSLKHTTRMDLGDDIECVYWDFEKNKWSSEGCKLIAVDSNRETTVCECKHLTNFAALMDTSGREVNGAAKNAVTLVFCALSVLCLIVTITTKRKNYNEMTKQLLKRRDIIVLNLSACLLVSNLLIMIGMDRTEVEAVCKFLSFLLLYTLLATFLWMLLQAFHLFRMTYNVFDEGVKAFGEALIGNDFLHYLDFILGIYASFECNSSRIILCFHSYEWIANVKRLLILLTLLENTTPVGWFTYNCTYKLQESVKCITDSLELNIGKEFELLDNDYMIVNKGFDRLEWSAVIKGRVLPANVFKSLHFKSVSFSATNLQGIHTKAFVTQKGHTKIVEWNHLGDKATQLQNFPDSDYDLYKAFSSIPTLQKISINLDANSAHEIPDYAFKRDNTLDSLSLTSISFNGPFVISRIGNNVFYYAKNLSRIHFFGVKFIQSIHSKAFRLQECDEPLICGKLLINLESTQLNESSLETGVFDIKGRVKSKYYTRVVETKCWNQKSIWDFNWNYCHYTYYYNLYCHSKTHEVDIDEEFNNLDKTLDQNNRFFENFEWSAPIQKGILPENAFKNVGMYNIEFTSTNLELIHVKAFDGPAGDSIVVWKHSASQPTRLQNIADSNYDLYKAFSSISTLNTLYINLKWNFSHEIPNYAFNTSPQLKYIAFNGHFNISRVGDFAFYNVKNIQTIDLNGIDGIELISANAFQIQRCDYEMVCPKLFIILKSTHLSEWRLETGYSRSKYESRVLYTVCPNGMTIWEFEWEPHITTTTITTTPGPTTTTTTTNYDPTPTILITTTIPTTTTIISTLSTTTAISSDPRDPMDSSTASQSTLSTSTVTQTTITSDVMCNKDGSYNDKYGVKVWPPVSSGEDSIVDCPTGRGTMRWKCLEDGKFDDRGPEDEYCWLEDLDGKDISSVEDVMDSVETIVKNTVDNNELKSMKSLEKVMKIVDNLNIYLQNNDSFNKPSMALNISENFIQLFSQMIDQSLAWADGNASQRLNTASDLLLSVQLTEVHFEYNSSSIFISNVSESEVNNEEMQSCLKHTSLGVLINELQQYLRVDSFETQVNSDIIAFSLKNTINTQKLNNGSYARVRLKHKNRLVLGDRVECVFWDFTLNKWSSEGCRLIERDSNRETTVCECNHLTNFAALMDTSGRETDDEAKNILTQICCGVSIRLCWISSPKNPNNIWIFIGPAVIVMAMNIIFIAYLIHEVIKLKSSVNRRQVFGFLLLGCHYETTTNSLGCYSPNDESLDIREEFIELEKTLNEKHLNSFVWIAPIVDSIIPENVFKVIWCNSDGQYDGQHGIAKWPVVRAGEYSEVKCEEGEGMIRWRCLENGTFDGLGPMEENCWLEDLINKNITSVEDVNQSLDTIVEKTVGTNGLQSMDDQTRAWDEGSNTRQKEMGSQLLLYIQYTGFSSN